MRRVAFACLMAMMSVVADIESARANDDDEPTDAFSEAIGGLDYLSMIADAHAQFVSVLLPERGSRVVEGELSDVTTYAGVDAWRYGGSLYTGSEWSPDPQSKFVLRGFGSVGLDDFRSATTSYRSATARASILPGLHIQSDKLDVKVLLGLDYMARMPLRPALDWPVEQFGGRITIEAWWEPQDRWMISGSASATAIESGLSGRLAAGWRLPFAWIGPEALVNHDIFNTQYRAGVHLSSIEYGITAWSIAAGYGVDSFSRSGPYGRIGVTLRP